MMENSDLFCLFSTIQDFEDGDQAESSSSSSSDLMTDEIMNRVFSMSRPRIGTHPSNFLVRAQTLADNIWNWETRYNRIKPIICDFVTKAELVFFLMGLGPNDDRQDTCCMVCQGPLKRFFSILWNEAQDQPYKYVHYCKHCALHERRDRSANIRIIECKLVRWKLSSVSQQTLPNYVKNYFECVINQLFHTIQELCFEKRALSYPCKYLDSSHLSRLRLSVLRSVPGLLKSGHLRKHLVFVNISCAVFVCLAENNYFKVALQSVISLVSCLSAGLLSKPTSNEFISNDSISELSSSEAFASNKSAVHLDRLLVQLTQCKGPGVKMYRNDGSFFVGDQTSLRSPLPAFIQDGMKRLVAGLRYLPEQFHQELLDDADDKAYWRFVLGHWIAIQIAATQVEPTLIQDCTPVQS